jgi:hypothetical protein
MGRIRVFDEKRFVIRCGYLIDKSGNLMGILGYLMGRIGEFDIKYGYLALNTGI